MPRDEICRALGYVNRRRSPLKDLLRSHQGDTMRHFLLPILLGLAVVGAVGPWAPAQTPNPDAAKAGPPFNSQLALWLSIKRYLMGPHGKQYYESNLQNTMIPDGRDDIRT